MAGRTAWAGMFGMAALGLALSGCGDRDDGDVHSANTQAAAAKDPVANTVAPAPANVVDPAEAERRAQAAAARRTSLAAQEDALSTAPAPYEGDNTAATSLPPQTDDAPSSPPSGSSNATGPHA